MVRFLQTLAVAASCLWGAVQGQSDYPLCGLVPNSFTTAASQYNNYKTAIEALKNVTVATWYTDNADKAYLEVQKLLNKCGPQTLPVIVVYGLPHKDCKAGESNMGSNKDGDMYAAWIQQLSDLVANRPVIYIMEPDAVGLALAEDCAKKNGYLDNMAKAIPVLSENNNSLLYVDVGYWMMETAYNQTLVKETLKQFSSTGRVNGIALDTSNYRLTSEMETLCEDFGAITNNEYKCVIDTSRNYRGPKAGTGEWCNSRYAALGVPSTNNTANDAIDYFLWLKTPGESDGTCVSQGSDSLKGGPAAGAFFQKAFSLMWDRGYFVDVLKMAKFGEYSDNVDLPTDNSGTSYLALGLVIGGCVIVVIVGIIIKRRYDAKQGRRRYAENNIVAAPRTNEAGTRKPYLSL
ncbi:glycoside hydrolase [Achlya hypogyna]|uniref:Glycoside hydrolase n=1 Tax=Achlya hypogyna TaxID=1202772 RepID=A0A1V9ZNM8_ACHHY|nr:glycoside hydrolase [Achlya hypogyna]